MDLSKAYDCLPNDIFDNISLKLFHSYFSNREQRVKIGSAISAWIDILTGSPQGSIFINDLTMFVEKSDIYNFADDNTLCKSSPRLKLFRSWHYDCLKLV